VSISSFTPVPPTGNAFIGRQGLATNLRWRIARGESLAVIGGPKLGKTSLVRTALQGIPDRTVVEVDLAADSAPRIEEAPGWIVILDNLDALAVAGIPPLLAHVSAAQPASIVVTGGRRLRTLLADTTTMADLPFRVFPLSVLLDGETRRLIGQAADPALATWTGNHPYLTKLLLHYGEDAIAAGRSQWEAFVQQLAAEIGHGPERQLLRYLIDRGQPVNPTVAQSDTGISDIKAVADTLVYLGAISRWIRDEEATLFAGCRLLNDAMTGDIR
jgi:hypothetical protein